MEDDDEKKEAAPPPLTDCIPLSIRLGMIEFARLIAAEEVTETSRRSAGVSDKPPLSLRGPCASAAVSHLSLSRLTPEGRGDTGVYLGIPTNHFS